MTHPSQSPVSEMTPTETIWFYVESYYAKIIPARVVKETEKTVSVVGRYGSERAVRSDKNSASCKYFPTWEEAHAYLLSRCEGKAIGCRRALEIANSELGNVKGMKKPEAA